MANNKYQTKTMAQRFTTLSALLQATVLVMAGLIPVLFVGNTSAASLTSRSATLDQSAINSTDVELIMGYVNIDTAATKAGIMYEFCDNPLGTCTLPTGMDVQTANSHDGQTGWPDNADAFAPVSEAADVGQCTADTDATNFRICYDRDEAVSTTAGGGAATHTISGVTAPSSAQTVYVRITTYSNDDFLVGNILDTGTVAVAFVDQLTITGRVQERLDFCVAALDDAAAVPANVAACTGITDTNVDLGIITESAIAITPVEIDPGVNGSDDDYGILMLNTNATAGAVISFYPETDVGGTEQLYAFRVDNAICNSTDATFTDQCFRSAGASGSGLDLTASGTEGFGLTVACVDQSLSDTTALVTIDDWYNGDDDNIADLADCDTADAGNTEFGWNSSTTVADTLVSSSGVVDDEVVKVLFGAQAATTTPSGEYTVVTTYIATVTF